jgi:K+-transporting ATPase ATPase C chain
MIIVMTVVTGLAYPLAMTGLAQLLFPDQANGNLLKRADGTVVGSALIGQSFTEDKYFHGRPSATTDRPYNAESSGGSSLGPTSRALIDRVKEDAAKLREQNRSAPIPVDLVTASASGLDPDISPAAAEFQVPRVAKARGLPETALRALVGRLVQEPYLGLVGERRINVLALNMALDHLR